jgi:flagellar FliL protein
MAEETEAPEKDAEPEQEEGGKKKKMILFAGIGVLVLAIGGGAFMFMGGSKPADENQSGENSSQEESQSQEEGKKDEKGSQKEDKKEEGGKEKDDDGKKSDDDSDEKSEVKIDFGAHYNLKTFSLNLGNPLENRFLKMNVSLEYKGGEAQKKELEARVPQLRDAVINVASKKTREFLLGPDGKDQLRLEMLNRINQYMDRKIEAVFITDIIIE